ncbi:MAG TPA: hypothetical protein VIY51_05260 [Xanthobacteraceae bacterium]
MRLAYSAPEADRSVAADILRYTLPATKALPFVKLRDNDQPFWRPESFWRVEPTGNRNNDLRLGRRYARLAIAAMKADRDSQLLACIIQDIMRDVAGGTGKQGRAKPSPVALGFLAEISETIAAVR